MSTLTQTAERIAAAGCSRAAVASLRDGATAEYAGSAFTTSAVCGWSSNPMPAPVKATQRHDLTPAPRPEEALP